MSRLASLWRSPVRRVTFLRAFSRSLSDGVCFGSCPAPCSEYQSIPEGLDIDYKSPLAGTMAAYDRHVVIATGKKDWTSRIEDEENLAFVRALKRLISRGGKFHNPYHQIIVSASSFIPETSQEVNSSISAFVFPNFKYIPAISTDLVSAEEFAKDYLLPGSPINSGSSSDRYSLEMDVGRHVPSPNGAVLVDEVVILICSHGGRDMRCGILGPILAEAFQRNLVKSQFDLQSAKQQPSLAASHSRAKARVGMISHIGGHKFAGNVIIYVPRTWKWNPLAGWSIWYGRVCPEHVEGLIHSFRSGIIVKEHFRGALDGSGRIVKDVP
ncbi:Sucrase/ferredoxin-like-domain-containing protein [Lineolata rhizophorae]|uniref:Altered inheritance of mitochondria protein 32 n=1 Tax=Lineolata rhizophorae TaxID=578093 RepID=A0A6A6PEG5_9PEZI|nr:Sucrase/ferredoxin-like-domain-containing protein [Lineolata rhizophorae]